METLSIPLLDNIENFIINPAIKLLFGVALIVFLYGLVRFVAKAGDQKSREEGKKSMLWGIIGMAIMASVYGIQTVIVNTISQLAGIN